MNEKPKNKGNLHIQKIGKRGWISLGVGLLGSIAVYSSNFLAFAFHYFTLLVHEAGHTIFDWIFGYPSIPYFDFVFGGGVTISSQRSLELIAIIYIIFGIFLFVYMNNILTAGIIFTLMIVYSIFAFTFLHHVVDSFMGYGTEVIFGVFCLYMSIRKNALIHILEKPVFAFFGFLFLLHNLKVSYFSITPYLFNPKAETIKDFMNISEEYLPIEPRTISLVLFISCFICMIGVYFMHRYSDWIKRALIKIIDRRNISSGG